MKKTISTLSLMAAILTLSQVATAKSKIVCHTSMTQDLTVMFEIQDQGASKAAIVISESRFYNLEKTTLKSKADRSEKNGQVLYRLLDYKLNGQKIDLIVDLKNSQSSVAVSENKSQTKIYCEN